MSVRTLNTGFVIYHLCWAFVQERWTLSLPSKDTGGGLTFAFLFETI